MPHTITLPVRATPVVGDVIVPIRMFLVGEVEQTADGTIAENDK